MQRQSLHSLNCGAKQIGLVPSYWFAIGAGSDRTPENMAGVREGLDE
jgi:hypothetical protein